MDTEDRTGSAESENGSSDSSYVKVTPEDANSSKDASPIAESTIIPSCPEDDDVYMLGKKQEPTFVEPVQEHIADDDPFHMDSHEAQHSRPDSYSSTIEDVAFVKSNPESTSNGDLLSFLNILHPAVLYLVYWKDPKLSAVVLGGLFVVLLTLTLNTFIHTIVLLHLSFLVVSLSYVVAMIARDSFYNKQIQNPFSNYLDITLPEDKVADWAVYVGSKLNCMFSIVVRLLLFENIKQSFKFGITLWILSFVTNYLTLLRALFVGVTVIFVVPPIYAMNQRWIDQFVHFVVCRTSKLFQGVLSHIPFLKDKMQ